MSSATGGNGFRLERKQGLLVGDSLRWWLLAVALLGLLFLNLGNRGLNEPDEGRYSNIAGEMLEGEHGWWEPRMSDYAHYDKPPMVYWLTAASFNLFGRSEWSARLPCVLGAVLTLVGLGWTAWRLHGSRIAWWAVLFCGTMGQFWVLARMLTPDMLLTGFSTLAVGCWAEARHRGQLRWWWGCALFATLAWWTKATAALVPLLGLTLGLLLTRDRRGLQALRPLRLLGLLLVLGAPWYVALMLRHPELEGFFFGRELAGRIVGHPDGRHGPIYYHVGLSLICWAPWWPAALAALFVHRSQVTERLRQLRWQAVPLEAWMVLTGLAVFSLMSSKLVTYTLPFAPWAALLCARVILRQPSRQREAIMVRRALATATVWAILFVVASFALPQWETRLGVSSTLREVSRELHQRHAAVAYLDRYVPGVEFYFGEQVFYVTDHIPRQLPSDSGFCEELGESHFVKPEELSAQLAHRAAEDVWLVRYKGRTNSPLASVLQEPTSRETVRIGDYVLDHVSVAPVGRSAAARKAP